MTSLTLIFILSGFLVLTAAVEDKEVEKLGMFIQKLLGAEIESVQPDHDVENENKALQVQGKIQFEVSVLRS